ncbi:MAG: SDR family oxidoreductase [Nocardiopsaceae bacterium]|nr:SDR family oxidoreductase [Nocardiopsaceae bacterium]
MAELRFDGRVAIVTGAGHGLGRSYALELAARGAKVLVNDVGAGVDGTPGTGDEGGACPAERVVAEARGRGGTAEADNQDVSTEDGAQSLVDSAVDTFGRVDIIVNNAGILRDRSFKNITAQDWDAVISVHLRGTFLVSHAAFAHMRENGYGRIVNTTSPAGLFGSFGQSNYAAAKMGVIGLTKTLAVEGAKYDITANAIAPAAYTRMTDDMLPAGAQDFLSPERVTPAVVWLAHEDCETTGETYSVGGGRVARVFVAEGPGAAMRHGTPEELRDNWPEVNAERPYVIPRNVTEQMHAHYQKRT